MAGNLFLTPAILLSGLVFPIANMPVFFQYLTKLNPLMYFIIVTQGVFLKGAGLALLWPQMLSMTVLGSGCWPWPWPGLRCTWRKRLGKGNFIVLDLMENSYYNNRMQCLYPVLGRGPGFLRLEPL